MNNSSNITRWAVTSGLLALFIFNSNCLYAQSDDFGYELGISGETKIASGLKLEFEADMRTQDDAEKIDRYTLGAGLSYRLYQTEDKKFSIKANAGFDYLWTQKLEEKSMKYFDEADDLVQGGYFKAGDEKGYNITEKYWRDRYRINAGLSASYSPYKRWSFSLKETIQQNHYCDASPMRTKWRVDEYNSDVNPDGSIDWKTTPWAYSDEYVDDSNKDADGNVIGKSLNEDVDVKNHKDRTILRSKLEASYDIKDYPIDIFASVDYGCGLNYSSNKWKFTIGYDYKINKTNKLTLQYRYNTEDDDDEVNGHLVGLSYKFDF